MNKVTTLALAVLLPLGHAFAAADIASGLVGQWRFDGCDGKSVKDLSGHGNDGAIAWGELRKEQGTTSLELDGLDGHVLIETKTPLDLTTEITTALWVKVSRLRNNTVLFGIPNANPDWTTPVFGMYASGGRVVYGQFGDKRDPEGARGDQDRTAAGHVDLPDRHLGRRDPAAVPQRHAGRRTDATRGPGLQRPTAADRQRGGRQAVAEGARRRTAGLQPGPDGRRGACALRTDAFRVRSVAAGPRLRQGRDRAGRDARQQSRPEHPLARPAHAPAGEAGRLHALGRARRAEPVRRQAGPPARESDRVLLHQEDRRPLVADRSGRLSLLPRRDQRRCANRRT